MAAKKTNEKKGKTVQTVKPSKTSSRATSGETKSARGSSKEAVKSVKPSAALPKSSKLKKAASSVQKSPSNQPGIDTSVILPGTEAETAQTAIIDVEPRTNTSELEPAQMGQMSPDDAPQIIYSLRVGATIYVKTADIVAALKRSTAWVRELTTRKIFMTEQTKHGELYNLLSTIRAYVEYRDNGGDDDESKEYDLRKKKAEALYKERKADQVDMQVKELQGKLHRSEDVQKMTADLLYFVRGGLLALAGRCATECAASSEPAEVQQIIRREVNEILKELSEYKYDPQKYNELVRQRTNRDLDDYFLDDDENE